MAPSPVAPRAHRGRGQREHHTLQPQHRAVRVEQGAQRGRVALVAHHGHHGEVVGVRASEALHVPHEGLTVKVFDGDGRHQNAPPAVLREVERAALQGGLQGEVDGREPHRGLRRADGHGRGLAGRRNPAVGAGCERERQREEEGAGHGVSRASARAASASWAWAAAGGCGASRPKGPGPAANQRRADSVRASRRSASAAATSGRGGSTV
jgi:hypothetical protein